MIRIASYLRFALLTAMALAVAGPALAQQSDPDFTRTLRELNADVDYRELFREGADGDRGSAQPTQDQAPAQGRTYRDPGQNRPSDIERDREASTTLEGSYEQQLIDTVREADRIGQ